MHKTYVITPPLEVCETIKMRGQDICFYRERRKMLEKAKNKNNGSDPSLELIILMRVTACLYIEKIRQNYHQILLTLSGTEIDIMF